MNVYAAHPQFVEWPDTPPTPGQLLLNVPELKRGPIYEIQTPWPAPRALLFESYGVYECFFFGGYIISDGCGITIEY